MLQLRRGKESKPGTAWCYHQWWWGQCLRKTSACRVSWQATAAPSNLHPTNVEGLWRFHEDMLIYVKWVYDDVWCFSMFYDVLFLFKHFISFYIILPFSISFNIFDFFYTQTTICIILQYTAYLHHLAPQEDSKIFPERRRENEYENEIKWINMKGT